MSRGTLSDAGFREFYRGFQSSRYRPQFSAGFAAVCEFSDPIAAQWRSEGEGGERGGPPGGNQQGAAKNGVIRRHRAFIDFWRDKIQSDNARYATVIACSLSSGNLQI